MNPKKKSLAFGAQILLAGLGLWVSLDLVAHHIESNYGKGGDTGLCTALSIFSCEAAARSDFSAIAGLPIAVIGAGYFSALLLLFPLARFGGKGFARLADVFFLAGLGSVAYSLFLLAVSALTLGKVCPLCLTLYAVNIALAVLSWRTLPAGVGAVFKGLFSLALRFEGWLTLVLVAGAIFGFQSMYAVQAKARLQASKAVVPAAGAAVELDLAEAPVRGPADAAITIVEFSDFQCPYCRLLAEALDEAARQHGNVRILFRHFPMDDACNPAIPNKFHEFACGAAKASLCAEAQGKFWEMHDRLFSRQKELAADQLPGHAAALGLDAERFQACLAAPETAERLKRDLERADSVKVPGTPMWFVNGLKYVGARKPEEILAILERVAPGARKGPAPDGR